MANVENITDAQLAECINNMTPAEKWALITWLRGLKSGIDLAAQKGA